MAAEFWFNDSGTQRKSKEVYFNDGGTLRKAKEIWYNDNGNLRKVFSAGFSFTPTFVDESSNIRPWEQVFKAYNSTQSGGSNQLIVDNPLGDARRLRLRWFNIVAWKTSPSATYYDRASNIHIIFSTMNSTAQVKVNNHSGLVLTTGSVTTTLKWRADNNGYDLSWITDNYTRSVEVKKFVDIIMTPQEFSISAS
ncbi:hypothetical protein VIBNISOn1_1190028 [Vibrio nigripulchritudo SOn1]|uniref:Uncharacterized protein n=1 Tax=Vibrio nigripulchritudo SOn1 TaxID=1238450 RepID=A0AAV2VJ66_9VIBR|nr:hypothetical protein [Vibrio nigripulchritudo]CCO44683.1 hypothetical protein VIBNISOn1_1190028 [Vibrio nigripulchritudo SOn1]